MHNSCAGRILWFVRFNAPPVFVSLNALDGWEGCAFSFSNDRLLKDPDFSEFLVFILDILPFFPYNLIQR